MSFFLFFFFKGLDLSSGLSYASILSNSDNQGKFKKKKKKIDKMTRYIECVCVHVTLPKEKFIHTHHNLVNQQELCCDVLSQWMSPVS